MQELRFQCDRSWKDHNWAEKPDPLGRILRLNPQNKPRRLAQSPESSSRHLQWKDGWSSWSAWLAREERSHAAWENEGLASSEHRCLHQRVPRRPLRLKDNSQSCNGILHSSRRHWPLVRWAIPNVRRSRHGAVVLLGLGCLHLVGYVEAVYCTRSHTAETDRLLQVERRWVAWESDSQFEPVKVPECRPSEAHLRGRVPLFSLNSPADNPIRWRQRQLFFSCLYQHSLLLVQPDDEMQTRNDEGWCTQLAAVHLKSRHFNLRIP